MRQEPGVNHAPVRESHGWPASWPLLFTLSLVSAGISLDASAAPWTSLAMRFSADYEWLQARMPYR